MMLVERWIQEISDRRLRARVLELRQRYEFLARNLFADYQPTRRDSRSEQRDFMKRMELWLGQFHDDKERLVAFRSIEYLFFAGVQEYDELYRCAYQEIERWLLEINELDPFTANESIRSEVRRCWICPVTDSLLINSFLHVTGISGQQYRPDWFSLSQLGDAEAIQEHVRSNNLRFLVLLEDFVGSGRRATKVVRFAASVVDVPILVLPLIICEPGVEKMNRLSAACTRVTVRPIVTIPYNCLVGPTPRQGEPATFPPLRTLMRAHYGRLGRRLNGKGFGFGRVGSMMVTYSNCPNNTPPLYHWVRPGDTALFPRLSRPWRQNESV